MERYVGEQRDYKYIDQRIIDNRMINAVNADVFAEAERYNKVAGTEYARKWRIHIEFYLWIAVLLAISLHGVWTSVSGTRLFAPDYVHYIVFLAEASFLFLILYFIIHRKFRNAKMAALAGIPLIFIEPLLIFFYAANIAICHVYDKYYKSIQDIPGYPLFSQLTVTTDSTRDIYGQRIKSVPPENNDGTTQETQLSASGIPDMESL